MNRDIQRAKAEAFRAMHDRSRILVLPNAWDPISARVIEQAGARAIATTSAGVAFSVGYADGEAAPRDEIIAAIARIARVTTVPLSADIEAGFARDTSELAETIKMVIGAGAVGINLEDSIKGGSQLLYDIEVGVARIRTARQAADSTGVPLVINARTDVFLHAVGEPSTRFEHAVNRANAYRNAGADCLFVPGLSPRDAIAPMVKALEGPLNLLTFPGLPAVAELEKAGVARVSAGTGLTLAAMGITRRAATELLERGTYGSIMEGALSYPEANKLIATRKN